MAKKGDINLLSTDIMWCISWSDLHISYYQRSSYTTEHNFRLLMVPLYDSAR